MKIFKFNPHNLFVFEEVMNTTASPGLAPEFQEYYDKRIIRKAGPNLVFAQFAVNKPLPEGKGKSITFRGFKDLDTTPNTYKLVEGVTPDGSTLEMYELTATLEQYGNYVKITDMVDMTAIDPMVNESIDVLSAQAEVVLDKLIRNALLSDEEVADYFAGGVADVEEITVETHKITVADVRRLVAYLKRVNAPKIDGKYPLILHTDVATDLSADEEYKDLMKYIEPKTLANGYVGDIVGARIYETTNALIVKNSNGVAVYHGHLIGQGSYGSVNIKSGALRVIVKQVGSGGTSDPLDQKGTIGWKATTTNRVLVPAYLINFYCSAGLNAVADAEYVTSVSDPSVSDPSVSDPTVPDPSVPDPSVPDPS